MERRSLAFGGFAVPAAIFELFVQKSIGQFLVRLLEIGADGEDSAVDARFRFAVKIRSVASRLNTSRLSTRSIILRVSLPVGSRPKSFKTTRLYRVISSSRSFVGKSSLHPRGLPPQAPEGDWRARSWAPHPSVATRDLSAAIASGASPVRSLMTCHRMAGSASRSHLMCAGRGAKSWRMGLL
jgi:hypothetical protein